jgi:ankyrin repeat protein
MFADTLELRDINALVCTSRVLNQLLTPFMYSRAKHERSRCGMLYSFRVVSEGNLTAVKNFIEVGTSVDTVDYENRTRPTALHICVKKGDIATAQILIQNGPNISQINDKGWTPLQYAARRRYQSEAMVRFLLDGSVDIPASSQIRDTMRNHHISPISRRHGDTLLHHAAGYGSVDIVRFLVEAGPNIEATNSFGETLLHLAAAGGLGDNVKTLLQRGANFDAINIDGLSPLQFFLSEKGEVCVAHQILHHESQPEVCSWKGSTTCVPACQFLKYRRPVVDLLLSAGASTTASSNSTRTPLDWAIWVVRDR